ncbi:hypothetical protein C7377_1125 [Balneicella halophila]|uniref:Outer membrane beta-barrel porin/alpha-amylase n=1 Tax=Balneicella halophila TaxID=1537566 RepID=A0A7L4UNX6_BALHA|nr:hypothetical protein [Balneicella halophila]PVX50808.1 hypothetical protein C7377_1125 [Balneicella halophila]
MKQIISIAICVLTMCSSVTAQYIDDDKDVSIEPREVVKRFETETWKTAYAIPQRQLHLSLLAPIRYGLLPKVELQTFLGLWAYRTPNIYVKKNWYEARWIFSSKHGVVYPTKGLEVLRDDDRDHTINKGAVIPRIFTFQNEIIASYVLNPTCNVEEHYWIATGRIGLDVSSTEDLDESFKRMTFFSLYHRTASFYGDKVWYAGLQLDGGLLKNVYFNIGADGYIGNDFHGIETQLNLVYHYNQKLSFTIGAKYIITSNPIEDESNYTPMIDVCYRFGKKSSWEKGLFGKKK